MATTSNLLKMMEQSSNYMRQQSVAYRGTMSNGLNKLSKVMEQGSAYMSGQANTLQEEMDAMPHKKVKKKKVKKQVTPEIPQEKPKRSEQHRTRQEEKTYIQSLMADINEEVKEFPLEEAIILSEIIGEPRCKTRHRRGYR